MKRLFTLNVLHIYSLRISCTELILSVTTNTSKTPLISQLYRFQKFLSLICLILIQFHWNTKVGILFSLENVKLSPSRPGQAFRIQKVETQGISRQSSYELYQGLQPHAPATFTPQEIYLLLISVRVRGDPRIKSVKNPINPNGRRTFRLVAQCINQVRDHVTQTLFNSGTVILYVVYVFAR